MQHATVQKKKTRLRHRLKQNQKSGRLRLSVHRTNKHMYAQVIDDEKGITIASASSMDKDFAIKSGKGSDIEAALEVGKKVAVKSHEVGCEASVF